MATEKQLEVRRLRDEGLSWAEVAAELGITKSAARARISTKSGPDTSRIGEVNKNRQTVIEATEEQGPHLQYVYVLRCGDCGHEYGCYGGDIFQKKCPNCQEHGRDEPRSQRTYRPAEGPPIPRK